MKHVYIFLLTIIVLGCTSTSAPKKDEGDTTLSDRQLNAFIPKEGHLPVTSFKEVWGYVVVGSEAALRIDQPVTDVIYFDAQVDTYGALSKVPDRSKLPPFNGRVHFALTCHSGEALTYFAILPGSPQRAALIRDLIKATQDYDGLNINFERIPARSGEAFLSFLRELRAGLPNKMLTVALYPRLRTIANDVYDYEKIKPFVDRIFVMAYDQHWSRGDPGPISSLKWCRSVAEYSLRVVGREKLIMGIPFYGRAWEDHNHHRAYTYSGIERLINTHHVREVKREEGTPTFDYKATLSVKVYYEDEYSISARFVMYKSMNIDKIGFWRIGQETPKVWEILKLE